jgi:tetratricopeptide (TPR) repeat protein
LADEEIRRASVRVLRPAERERHEPGEGFVGRERELAQLGVALDKIASSHGRMFLVSGEPGIGKTRLADKFSARAQARGLRVIWGRCWERAGSPAYWPIIQIIRAFAERPDFAQLTEALGPGIEQVAALVPEIVRLPSVHGERTSSGPIDPEQARFRLFDAVATLFKSVAQREPLIIVIDDLHDADLAALQMVCFLARALKDSPVMMLATHREAEVERSPELRTLFAELARESDQLPLRGLSLLDAAGLVRNRTGIVPDDRFLAMLHQTTAGNPLFLGGVVQTLIAEGKLEQQRDLTAADLKLPVNVRSAIARQLGGLSERTNSLLAAASALGVEFELAPLERVAPVPAAEILDCLDEAVAAGIAAAATESRGRYRFTHVLIQSAIYDSLRSSERNGLHRRIADSLEVLYASGIDSHLSELAHHYVEAISTGAADKAIDYSIRAGEAANAVFAYKQAISLWETALVIIDRHGGDTEKRADLLAQLGTLLQNSDTRLGIEHLESAVKAYDELNLPEQAALVRQRLGQILASPGERMDTQRALLHLRNAEAVLSKGQESGPLAALYYGLAQVASNQCLAREAWAAFTHAMEIAERVGAEGAWCASATQVVLSLHCFGRMSEGRELLARVWDRLPLIKDGPGLFGTAWAGGGTGMVLWDFRVARAWCQKGVETPMLAKYHHDLMRFQVGRASFQLGDLRESHRHIMELEQSVRDEYLTEQFSAFEHCDWERLRLIREADLEQARRACGRSQEQPYSHSLAACLRELGEHASAEEILQLELGRYGEEESQLQNEMLIRPELVLNYVAMGNLEAARAHILRCAEIVSAGEDWRGLAGHYHRAVAVWAAAEGDANAGEYDFAAAVNAFRRMSLAWHEADTLQFWGRALTSADRPEAAVEKLDAAIEIYRRIGAGERWIERVLGDRARVVGAPKTPSEKCDPCPKMFRKQGDYWAISFGAEEFSLKDSKGLHYIARLLHCPGERVSAIDLAAIASEGDSGGHKKVDLGDAGEVLDAKARADYKRRLDELREEIERLRRMNDTVAAERAEGEYEALSQHLMAAAGLGGRTRRAVSHRERARVAVTKSIKNAIESIRECNLQLGRHLANSIRTGHFCCYAPSDSTRWHF